MKSMLCAALLCLGLNGQAQPATPATAPAAPLDESAAAGPAQRGGEPKVQHLVSEDDRVRIEELRVRGITQRVSVQPKLPGVPAYAIGVNADGRDASQDRRGEGRALWQLLSF
jgi:hypothetical protein